MSPRHLPRELARAPRYKPGDLVEIVPEWRDPGATMTVFRVAEDNGDRLIICPLEWPTRLVPRELVAYYMVRPAPVAT